MADLYAIALAIKAKRNGLTSNDELTSTLDSIIDPPGTDAGVAASNLSTIQGVVAALQSGNINDTDAVAALNL